MKLEQSFTVDAPADVVFDALKDPARVAPCLPGAAIDDAPEDGVYSGTFKVKLGPTTANYNGSLKMESLDEDGRRATMSAKGTDKRGQGGATATIVSVVHDEGGRARVEVVTDFTITGRLARFGRSGMIEDISNRLLRDFASCLQGKLADGQAAAAAPVPSDAANTTEEPPSGAPETPLTPPGASAPRLNEVPTASEPLSGTSLMAGVLADRIKSNPLPLVGVLAVLLLLLRRRAKD